MRSTAAEPIGAPAADPTRELSARASHRPLELRLAHLRTPFDVQLPRLRFELLARRLIAAPHGGGLLAERSLRLAREVLQRLLALRAGLRLLHVRPRGGALLLGGHGVCLPRGTPSRLALIGA